MPKGWGEQEYFIVYMSFTRWRQKYLFVYVSVRDGGRGGRGNCLHGKFWGKWAKFGQIYRSFKSILCKWLIQGEKFVLGMPKIHSSLRNMHQWQRKGHLDLLQVCLYYKVWLGEEVASETEICCWGNSPKRDEKTVSNSQQSWPPRGGGATGAICPGFGGPQNTIKGYKITLFYLGRGAKGNFARETWKRARQHWQRWQTVEIY